MNSLAIECVFNRQLFDKVIELFFTIPHTAVSDDRRSQFGQRLRRAARSGFEAVKQKTRQGWPASLQQFQQQRNSSWDLSIDISARHILIPESAISRDSLLLVVDFGRLFVSRPGAVNCLPDFPGSWSSSKASTINAGGDEDDDNDEYCTPCSTPPNEWATSVSPPSPDEVSVSSNAIAAPVKSSSSDHDIYKVQFADLLVLICRVKDNWKQAHLKGTSAHHLLDRFSITISAEKAGRQSLPLFPLSPGVLQPDRPLLTLTASLPNLIAHINEQKIQALTSVATQFRSSGFSSSRDLKEEEENEEPQVEDDPDGIKMRESSQQVSDAATQQQSSNLYWLVVQFSIDRLSVELQSRSRSVAELQVGGVQANYSVRSTDNARLQTSDIHISVHSLLLVDAMQTLGPDYELLVATHRHVSVVVYQILWGMY